MSLEAIALDDPIESVSAPSIDGLVATCFDRAFLIFSLFVDDPRTCLDLSEGVFRALDGRVTLTEWAFYGELVTRVRRLPDKNEFLPGVAAESVLCWLLKDAAELNYAEIGALMTLDRGQVSDRIAEVRMALVA